MGDNSRGIGRVESQAPQYRRGKNYFFGIGIDSYSEPYNRLRNCVNDVKKVSETLLSTYDFEEEHMHLLFDNLATRKGIIKKLREVLDLVTDDDSLIFMYSGHGDNLDKTNVGFMIPVDAADEEDFINLSDIKSRLDAAHAKHIFVIFDSCFSGLLLTQRDARAQNLPENFPSRYAMTSGRNHPVDDGSGEHSPFAKALIDELCDNDDCLGSVMLAQRILDRFRRTGKDDDQLPAFGRISSDIEYEGQYYFYPKNYELSAARERTKRLEAEEARRVAEEAVITAERERKRAEKLARAATNAAAFMQAREYDPTLSMRMMQYNFQRHPDSVISHSMYYKIVTENTPLMSHIIKANNALGGFIRFSNNGQLLAHVKDDNTIAIFDVKTGALLKTLTGITELITGLAFMSDDKNLVLSSYGEIIQVLSIKTGKIVSKSKDKKGEINGLSLSTADDYVAIACSKNEIEIWSLKESVWLKPLVGHSEFVNSVFFLNKNNQLISGSNDGTVKLWNVESGACLKTFETGGELPFKVMASSDDKFVAACCDNNLVYIWDISTGNLLQKFGNTEKPAYDFAFSRDGLSSFVTDGSNVLKMKTLDTGVTLKTFNNQYGGILGFDLTKDGLKMAWAQNDGHITLWNLQNDLVQKTFSTDASEGVCMALSSDDKYLVTGYNNGKVLKWSLESGDILETLEMFEPTIYALAISPDNQILVVADSTYFYLIDFKTSILIKKIETKTSTVSAIVFANDGDMFAAIGMETEVKLWSVKTGEIIKSIGKHDDNINGVVFTPDNKFLITISSDFKTRLWLLETGALVRTYEGHENIICSVALSPDSKYVAIGCADNKAYLYEYETGRLLRHFEGHQDYVQDLAFTHDGNCLLTVSIDKTIKLWSVEKGIILKTYVGHTDGIHSMILCADNDAFVTAANDSTVRLWHISKAVEDDVVEISLFDMMDSGLTIEVEDIPQYFEGVKVFMEENESLSAADIEFKVKLHFKDPSVVQEGLKKLGLSAAS